MIDPLNILPRTFDSDETQLLASKINEIIDKVNDLDKVIQLQAKILNEDVATIRKLKEENSVLRKSVCPRCNGTGSIIIGGLEGVEEIPCPECNYKAG